MEKFAFVNAVFALSLMCALPARGDVRGKVALVKDAYCKIDLANDHGLKPGDAGRLIRETDPSFAVSAVVTVVKPDYFVVKAAAATAEAGDLFIYGDAAAQPPADQPDFDQYIGEVIDLRLVSGKEFLQVKLVRVDKQDGRLSALRVENVDSGRAYTLGFKAVARVSKDGTAIFESAAEPDAGRRPVRKTRQQLLDQQLAAKAAEQEKKWQALLARTGVQPWSEATDEEHEAQIAAHKEFIKKIETVYPAMKLYETENFLFYSNIPPQQVAPYVLQLDTMHKVLMAMYQIPRGTRVWLGKALVVAFISREQFVHFEQTYMNHAPGSSTYGLCHQTSTGEITVACYRGDNPADFGQMLVHETSHGFLHRYKTPARLPRWVNEGLAEYVGEKIVPASRQVKLKQKLSLDRIRETRSLGGAIGEERPGMVLDYGIASLMITYMIQLDNQSFAHFILNIKGGLNLSESLMDSYGATPEQLISVFGRTIGLPDLRP